MPRHRALRLAAALSCLAALTLAVTVSETVVGGFDTTNDPTRVFDDIGTLDLGLNTVSGSLSVTCTLPQEGTYFVQLFIGVARYGTYDFAGQIEVNKS